MLELETPLLNEVAKGVQTPGYAIGYDFVSENTFCKLAFEKDIKRV